MLLTAHDTIVSSWYRLVCARLVKRRRARTSRPIPKIRSQSMRITNPFRKRNVGRACYTGYNGTLLYLCREVAMNEKLIVQMDGKRTRIFNTKVDAPSCSIFFLNKNVKAQDLKLRIIDAIEILLRIRFRERIKF